MSVTALYRLDEFDMPRGPIDCMAIAGDLLAYSASGHLAVYDLSTQEPYAFLSPDIPPDVSLLHHPRISALTWCPTRPHEIAWLQAHDKYIHVANIFDMGSSTARVRVTHRIPRCGQLRYNPGGSHIAVLTIANIVEIYVVSDHKENPTLLHLVSLDGTSLNPGVLMDFRWLRDDMVVLTYNEAEHPTLTFCEFTIVSEAQATTTGEITVTALGGTHATSADVTQSSGVIRAVHYDPARKLFQITKLADQSFFVLKDAALRQWNYSPSVAFFDDGRALVMSCSGRVIVYDLQNSRISQVLEEGDEDMMLTIDHSSRRLAILRRNPRWWWSRGFIMSVHGPDEIIRVHRPRINAFSVTRLFMSASAIALVSAMSIFLRPS